VRIKSQLCWFNLPHLPTLSPPVSAKQRVATIPVFQPDEGKVVHQSVEVLTIEVSQVQSISKCFELDRQHQWKGQRLNIDPDFVA